MGNVKYSLFVLRTQKYALEKKIDAGTQEGWLDKAEEEMLENQVESLRIGIEILEKNL